MKDTSETRATGRVPATGRGERGTALMLTIGYLLAVSLFASVFLSAVHRGTARHMRERYVQACAAIAEGGLDKAAAVLQREPAGGYSGEEKTPLGAGWFSVTVTQVSAGAYHVESVGALDDRDATMGRVRIAADVVLDSAGRAKVLRWNRHYERPGR